MPDILYIGLFTVAVLLIAAFLFVRYNDVKKEREAHKEVESTLNQENGIGDDPESLKMFGSGEAKADSQIEKIDKFDPSA